MYECPGCGRNLKFDIATQMLSCEYCGNTIDPYKAEDKHHAKEVGSDEYSATIFTCSQCGGEIISADTEAAAFCSFCGASTILQSRIANVKKPHYVIPFKVTKDDCKKAYSKLMRKAIYAPKEAKKPELIDSFRGIYMPYWIYNMSKQGPITFEGTTSDRKGDYVYTYHHDITTNIDLDYKDIAYDASSNFSDELSGAIAPYNVSEKKNFTPAYLSGFYADAQDVAANVYEKRAKEAVSSDAAYALSGQKAISKYTIDHSKLADRIYPSESKKELAMFPVWFMSYRNKDNRGEEHIVYSVINGETGKIASDIPVDSKKFVLYSLILAIPFLLLFNLFFTIKPFTLLLVTTILNLVALIMICTTVNRMKKNESGEEDMGLSSVRKYDKAPQENEKKEFKGKWIPFVVLLICTIILLLFTPVSDIPYYVVSLGGIVVTLLQMISLVKNYNRMTMRPLPQFSRTGGDDSANS